MSNAGQGPLPTLTIPPSVPHNEPAGDVPLKQHAAPREAAAPSLHATASPLPVGAPGVTPPLSTASASRPLGRSGTLKGQQQQQQQQQQPRRDANISEDQGYEGGVERHGQANDFKDDDSDEQAASSSGGGNQARRPKLASHGSSGEVKARDHATPGAASVKPQAAARNSPSAHEGIRKSLPNDFPDADSFARSMQRNRNPSASAYAHPGKLPYGRGKQQGGGGGGGGPPKARSPSMTSQRSVEATSHPFPTPGLKKQDGFQFDQWKSLEEQRLDEDERKEKHWKRWGPYVSERQWVRPLFLSLSPSSSSSSSSSSQESPKLTSLPPSLPPSSLAARRLPSVRTTRPTATRGRTSRTSTRARARTAGARTASPASRTTTAACACRSRCGTASTRSSRSACSARPATRATTARTSRSSTGTSTRRRRTRT